MMHVPDFPQLNAAILQELKLGESLPGQCIVGTVGASPTSNKKVTVFLLPTSDADLLSLAGPGRDVNGFTLAITFSRGLPAPAMTACLPAA